jgi:hypothetical protein
MMSDQIGKLAARPSRWLLVEPVNPMRTGAGGAAFRGSMGDIFWSCITSLRDRAHRRLTIRVALVANELRAKGGEELSATRKLRQALPRNRVAFLSSRRHPL